MPPEGALRLEEEATMEYDTQARDQVVQFDSQVPPLWMTEA